MNEGSFIILKDKMKKLSKKEKYKQEKKQKIIDAALKVFAVKGFNSAKISDIAKEAKIADGTIYIYFKKKDDIIISLFQDKMGAFNKLLKEKIEEKKNAIDKLKTFISIHLKILSEKRELAEIFTIELRQSSKFMESYQNTELKDYAKLLMSIIDEGKKNKLFKDDIHTSIIWQFIFGILDQTVLTWVRKENSTEKGLQKMIKFVLLFILDSILIKEKK